MANGKPQDCPHEPGSPNCIEKRKLAIKGSLGSKCHNCPYKARKSFA
ncbi:hypothetical protein HN399_01400 [bacterium]|nr:hypothetical protein [bacterium]MBT7992786.1 hypothetical protein [bacterium]